MAEIITIAAANEVDARAQYEFEVGNRPGKQSRVLRAGEFEIARLNIVSAQNVNGEPGFAESTSGQVFALVVQFY